MSLWEYKVITSGKGGFATPAMLEKFLNDLGRDEWEIVEYHSTPDNLLAFTGLARRSTQRDWTLADAAAAAAKAEAEKLRAEFAAKFEAATKPTPAAAEAAPASFLEEKAAPDDGFRKPVDTSRDDDPEAQEEPKDDWDKLTATEEEELPVFFDAIKPHMRRNQRGPGMSVGTDYLAKKWDQTEDDIKGALVECGFVLPADEDSRPEYVEYDGDLYWLNINRRGELWINTKEKPRAIFRNVKATRIEQPAEEPKPEQAAPAADAPSAKPHFEPRGRREREDNNAPAAAAPVAAPAEGAAPDAPAPDASGAPAAAPAAPAVADTSGAPLPAGLELLAKIRPLMRRNRRGPGGSGSASFLARAFKRSEAELVSAFVTLGLVMPTRPNDRPILTELDGDIWWLNQDSRGGLWINGREKKDGEVIPPPPAATADATAPAPSTETVPPAAPVEGATPAAVPVTEVATPESAPAPAPVASEMPAPTTEVAPAPAPTTEVAPASAPAPEPAPAAEVAAPATTPVATNPVLTAVRLLLKETRTGAFAGKLERVAEELGKSPEDFLATLVGAGLKVPDKSREKPVFVEHAGEIFWLNRNAKEELWLNAKASKFAEKDGDEGEAGDDEKKSANRRGSRAKKKDE
jgi:hypothetical protein